MSEKRNYGALVVGVVLICMGALTLFEKVFSGAKFWGFLWPLIIIGFGAMFFVVMVLTEKSFAWLAIPGSIIATNGLMLFLQNITGRWETWSYSWTVILMSVGIGIFIMGAWQGDESRRRSGLKVVKVGVILFIIFGSFFEILFSLGAPSSLRDYIFPIALILLGIYLVVKRSGRISSPSITSTIDPTNIEKPENPEPK
jgi:hypothetical protein